MTTANIKRITEIGYGFATTANDGDVFIHRTDMATDSDTKWESLEEGDVIELDVTTTAKGKRGLNIKKAETATAE